MTPQDHNKVIGIMHLIWGGFHLLTVVFIIPFMWLFWDLFSRDPRTPPEMKTFFGAFVALMCVFMALLAIPPIASGYAMLKRRSWAKVAGIVTSCLCALSFPFGTALCVYTFWFLFSDGENFYRTPDAAWRGSLRDANTFDWQTRGASAARQRTEAPTQPPDWRS
jgi:hypothetical protein